VLQLEQVSLAVQTAGVSSELAVGSAHPRARDEDRQRVGADEAADVTGVHAATDLVCQRAVTGGLAVWDFGEQLPDLPGPFAAKGVERQIEFLAFAREVFAQLRDRLIESVVVARLDSRPEGRLVRSGPVPGVVQTGQSVVVAHQGQRSDR